MANQHVVPNNGQWQVKRENATRATKTFDTQCSVNILAGDL